LPFFASGHRIGGIRRSAFRAVRHSGVGLAGLSFILVGAAAVMNIIEFWARSADRSTGAADAPG
ncbi:MAG: hypothetical protein L0H00_04520, partial [Micrococcales bacterium]|nr:hypothetical protein [Micrococcales bacterium]